MHPLCRRYCSAGEKRTGISKIIGIQCEVPGGSPELEGQPGEKQNGQRDCNPKF